MKITVTMKCVFEEVRNEEQMKKELRGKAAEEIQAFIFENKAEAEEDIRERLDAKKLEIQSVEVEE